MDPAVPTFPPPRSRQVRAMRFEAVARRLLLAAALAVVVPFVWYLKLAAEAKEAFGEGVSDWIMRVATIVGILGAVAVAVVSLIESRPLSVLKVIAAQRLDGPDAPGDLAALAGSLADGDKHRLAATVEAAWIATSGSWQPDGRSGPIELTLATEQTRHFAATQPSGPFYVLTLGKDAMRCWSTATAWGPRGLDRAP